MQIQRLRKHTRGFINYFLGPLLFLWVSYSIYNQLRRQPDLERSWQHIRDSFGSVWIWNLVLAFVLMAINWGIETFKWKLCIQKIQRISFVTAFKAVLSGISFSVTTPNRVGEYLGRVLYMDDGNRLRAIALTITGSISQLIVTLLMGVTGLIILQQRIIGGHLVSAFWVHVILYGTAGTLVLLTVFYFRLSWVIRWIDRLPVGKNTWA